MHTFMLALALACFAVVCVCTLDVLIRRGTKEAVNSTFAAIFFMVVSAVGMILAFTVWP